MFKKLLSFACWALLLCMLFALCVIFTFVTEKSLIIAPVMWVGLIIAILLARFLWVSISAILHGKTFAALRKRLKMSRMEYVLSEHWKAGASVIKRIRRQKQPLPWFVLTGGRSGKTTLMAGAGLPLFSNEPESSVVVPTRTLRWWFFRSAGFLDLSSLFLSKTPAFERGWLRLVNWCGRIPAPAGIVVCVPASALMEDNGVDLHLHARHIRTQIEPLIKKVKCRLPVYLFITCSDTLPGFSLWANRLSPAQRQQALGYYWPVPPVVDGKDPAFLHPLFNCVKDGLDKVRVSMLSGGEPNAQTLALLDFPERLPQLRHGLQRYLAALCEPDVYFEPATLGGVWFTATEPVSKNSAARQAFFLHDLMTRLLPDLSRQREAIPIGFGRRFLQQWGGITASALAIAALLASGIYSHKLLTGDVRTMDVEAKVQQLKAIEAWHETPLRYLAYVPALLHRQGRLETSILASTPRQAVNPPAVNALYQQQFAQATAEGRREMILALAHAIMTKRAMLDGTPVSELVKHEAEPDLLSMTGAINHLTREHSLVLQRTLLQQPGGQEQLHSLRQLLVNLVNRDPQADWLSAPYEALPAVHISDFQPLSSSEASLDGLWTLQGTAQMRRWLADIRSAAGARARLPVLDAAEQRWNTLRQTQWMSLMLAFNREQVPALSSGQWQSALIAIDQGNSPAMKLARYAYEQLADISRAQAMPWLRELRQLHRLQAAPASGGMMQRASRLDQSLRQKVAGLLRLDVKNLPPVVSALGVKNWNEWRKGVHSAVADVFATSPSSNRLTRDLFQAGSSADGNPLQILDGRFSALRKSMSDSAREDYAVNAVWSLYQSDNRWLVAHAMQRTGCWLEQQWQSRVLWPMEKNLDRLSYPEQQDLAWQYLTDFVRGPAKSALTMGDNGPEAGTFDGQTAGLTPEFLRIVNHVLHPDDVLAMPEREDTRSSDTLAQLKEEQGRLESQLAALEARPLELTLTSQPATIPGGARLMPTGTQLVLFCDEQSWELKSMNFSEQKPFRWRPGHCSRVSVKINFPGFDLKYDYFGDGAWPDFLSDLADGGHSYEQEDFPQEAAQLAALGIKNILVRYEVSSPVAVHDAWRKWRTLNDALTSNADARDETSERKAEKLRPTGLKSGFSQLPAHIADCR
ncbi:type VI secretion system protein [Dryocola sp. BD626]|uniref:type VI secretion system protein n=1 Tax=Dryocola sp. BD626 TaxID=3133273 RepID=UPI003F4FB05C